MYRINALIAAGLLLTVADGWSQGTGYPSKVVRIVNPVAPGGNQETIARTVADQLTRILGQPFVIESRPASSAIVGTRYVKSAPPDGYTLLAISNTFVRVPAMMAEPGYDPVRDFAAISMTGEVPLVLVINPALPVKTVKEFIALARQRPGELTSASSGVGSTGHVATEIFSRQAGVRMLNIQYKGAAPAVIDLVGGHVMLRFDQVTTSLPFIRSGALGNVAMARAQWHKKQSWRTPASTPEREREVNWRLRQEISTGIMGEIGVHQLDMVSLFLNARPVSVTGFGSVIHWNDGRDVADTVQTIVEYPGGV